MEKVEDLVDRAKHLVLHEPPESESHTVEKFHPSLDDHIQKIYKSVQAYAPTTNYFLKEIQHDPTLEDCPEPVNALASLDAFREYMKDGNSSAMGPENPLDLSAPLSDYFISSSHNTYLTGNQLYSDAASSAYTSVLLRGCRSVEIDVWDGELDSDSDTSSSSSDSETEEGSVGSNHMPVPVEPRVLHGHTLTKGTTFREICHAIRDSAFVASDLPLVVSLEVHASLEQQQTMVDIMLEVWKGLLVEASPDEGKLPPLANLKRKILIKSKCVPFSGEEEKPEGEDLTPQKSDDKSGQQAPKPSKILDALAKLAVYTRAYKFSHFDQPEAKVPLHVFSLSEKAARETHANQRDALFEHNRTSLMRIYPYAFRVNSSNLDPTFYWRRGAQLVALNWQNTDKGMMLNHGMFVGSHGWRLKPSGYRSSNSPTEIIERRNLTLSIEIYAAQDLSLPPGDHSERGFKPYVNCQLHVEEPGSDVSLDQDDGSSDAEKSSYRRCTKSSSGRNPDFKGQKLEFPTVTGIIEELSFLRFKIKDDELGRDPLAAWACIRLDRLREGYRLVHLHECAGEKTGGVLLVNIVKQVT
ncbi:Pc20g06170 [Penicillium rubens Wisconsin 54-1255]|uniref:Phosphoinositide phospholipase C n=1 Tax=Penicillium rubens (strain ATCC 28089 / DSM 1075 / NRRL 1951 / Wisconsin 54-1255) TaxID=500485 RepID=B6HG38_PENRW|nr:Pc20g06170 [Penicillium rubens Wisconsin 54-1255]